MHNVISLCKIVREATQVECSLGAAKRLTSGKHALYEVVDITKDNSEPLWRALLTSQGLDLDALHHWL